MGIKYLSAMAGQVGGFMGAMGSSSVPGGESININNQGFPNPGFPKPYPTPGGSVNA